MITGVQLPPYEIDRIREQVSGIKPGDWNFFVLPEGAMIYQMIDGRWEPLPISTPSPIGS
jgi:hypothetical protein